MNGEERFNEAEEAAKQQVDDSNDNAADESEFKVTVRKLEVPVRPRGVLAE